MERVLRRIGNAFISVANAFGEWGNAIHAYLIDRAFADDHSREHHEPVMSLQPSDHFRSDARIIIFPDPVRYRQAKMYGHHRKFQASAMRASRT